jgi:hypothetical protein
MSAWRFAVISIALLLIAAGVLQSGKVVNALIFCLVTAPIGRLLLRGLDDPWRVTMLGATVMPWIMVVREVTALLLVEPAAAVLILAPLLAGFGGLIAVLLAAREPVRGGYVAFMMFVLLVSIWAAAHPSMS